MKQNIFRRIARLVIQPLLFWLGARPDGLICDVEYSDHPGLLEIVLQTEEILLHQILSVISLSLSSKTKMEKFYLKKIIILVIIPKVRWLWGYHKIINVIKRMILITRIEVDNKYCEKTILNKF